MQDTGLRTRRLAAAGLVAAVCWQIAAGSGFFPGQRSTYGILTPDLVAGLEEVAETAPSEATLAITSLRDAPVGWWVEAITDRRTIYGAPLRWLLFADEIERAEVANRLFVPPFPDAARIGEAAGRGIDLVLVPTDWVFYDEDAMTEFRRVHPDAVEEVTPGLIVIDAGQLGT